MIGISLTFFSGRFHATPWGRHVNEGAPEWPPSPWRFLRALVAAWKGKLDGQLSQRDVEELLRKLIAPPLIVLPPAAAGHTRHYMPWFKNDKTLVFDTFVILSRDAHVVLLWADAALPKQREQLEILLRHLNFFGRAESWCSAHLLDEAGAAEALPRVNCRPTDGTRVSPDREIVRVLCADPERVFDNEYTPKTRSGKGKAKTTVPMPLYDPDWHLCMETLELHDKKWSDPPGSSWISYARPRNCFKVEPVRRIARPPRNMQVARFALDSTVLPLVTETLPVAESARRMLMGTYGRLLPDADGSRGRSAIFSGKAVDGRPLQGHAHAYYLPTDEDDDGRGDGRLDHLTIVATDGFSDGELKALDRLRELKTHKREQSGHPLRVLLLGLGRLDDYQPWPLRSSQSWVSVTPFVAQRHLKKRGTKRDPVELWYDQQSFLAEVLREELARLIHRRPELSDLSLDAIKIGAVVDQHGVFRVGTRDLRPIQFKRFRQKRGDDGGNRAAGSFQIDFGRSVSGPIVLGHSAHFGLGLFVPFQKDHRQ